MGAANIVEGLLGGENAQAAQDIYLSCLGNASQCYINLSEWGGAETNCSKANHDEIMHTELAMTYTRVQFYYQKSDPMSKSCQSGRWIEFWMILCTD